VRITFDDMDRKAQQVGERITEMSRPHQHDRITNSVPENGEQ
jgi:hypothetical protein